MSPSEDGKIYLPTIGFKKLNLKLKQTNKKWNSIRGWQNIHANNPQVLTTQVLRTNKLSNRQKSNKQT